MYFQPKLVCLAICAISIALIQIACVDDNTNTQEGAKTTASVPFKTNFTKPLEETWQWIRENPEAHKITDDGLAVKVEPGGLMGGAKDAKNILVRPLPENANWVQVRVHAEHKSQYEQAGLILYVDDDNYVKFVLEMVDGNLNAVMVPEQNAKPLAVLAKPVNRSPIDLVMQWEGEKLICSYLENNELIKVGEYNYPMDPRPEIGLFSQSGQPDTDRWVTFTNFLIKSQ